MMVPLSLGVNALHPCTGYTNFVPFFDLPEKSVIAKDSNYFMARGVASYMYGNDTLVHDIGIACHNGGVLSAVSTTEKQLQLSELILLITS